MISNIDHVVIFVTDMDKAINFYTHKLGLEVEYKSPEYTSIDTGGLTSIGLHIAEKVGGYGGGFATTQVSFSVDDIDKAYEEAEKKDIEITREIEEIAPGRFIFNFVDPFGNQLSCYEVKK